MNLINNRNLILLCVFNCIIFMAVNRSPAQQKFERHPQLDEAIKSLKSQEWQKMTDSLEIVVKEEPQNKFAWGLLGYGYHSAGQYDQAIEMFKKALSFSNDPFNAYNIAAAYSLKNEKDKSFEWLAEAIRFGYQDKNGLQKDTDLDNLRSDPRFAETLSYFEKMAEPCKFDEIKRQFDFWLGEWTAYSKQGQVLASVKVESVEKGCAIRENWSSLFGDSASILSFHNTGTDRWERVEITNGGKIHNFSGGIAGKAMRFRQTDTPKTNRKTVDYIEFSQSPDATIRKVWKTSGDDGSSGQIIREIILIKKK